MTWTPTTSSLLSILFQEIFQDILLISSSWLHIYLSPHTKVEESFNLHATHDVIMYGIHNLQPLGLDSKYDHFTFPGAVPRTFIGSVALAYLTIPFIHLFTALGISQTKFDIQIIARLVLSTLNALGIISIRRAVSTRFGPPTAYFYTLLTISQFHLLFWMGRTLPNMFALFFVNLSTSMLISPYPNPYSQRKAGLKAICIIIFTTVVFRAELALLLVPMMIQHLYRAIFRSNAFVDTVKQLVVVGGLVGVGSIGFTVIVDSYFWDRLDSPLWPELESVWFNVVEGKSVDWGVSPYRTYLLSSLPKLLLTAYPLSLITLMAPVRRIEVRSIVFPYLTFVLLISCLAHKEWRFIIYVVPVFNIAAARALSWVSSFQIRQSTSTRSKSNKGKRRSESHTPITFTKLLITILLRSIPSCCLLVNFTFMVLMTLASRRNYPGGEAMRELDTRLASQISNSTVQAHVHICNLAAQTGASLFTQTYSPPHYLIQPPHNHLSVQYTKTESLTPTQLTSDSPPFNFTHLIIEMPPEGFLSDVEPGVRVGWEVVGTVYGFERWVVVDGALEGGEKRVGVKRVLVDLWRKLVRDPWNRESWIEFASVVVSMEETEKLWILERRGWA